MNGNNSTTETAVSEWTIVNKVDTKKENIKEKVKF